MKKMATVVAHLTPGSPSAAYWLPKEGGNASQQADDWGTWGYALQLQA